MKQTCSQALYQEVQRLTLRHGRRRISFSPIVLAVGGFEGLPEKPPRNLSKKGEKIGAGDRFLRMFTALSLRVAQTVPPMRKKPPLP